MSAQTTEELWQIKAACRGPQASVFFPPNHFERKDEREEREARAKAICATCPVRKAHLDASGYTRRRGDLRIAGPRLTNG